MKIAACGGKIAKKKATVAVARKLAGMIYTLLQTDEAYDPQPSFSENLMIFKNFPLTNLLMEGVLRFIFNS